MQVIRGLALCATVFSLSILSILSIPASDEPLPLPDIYLSSDGIAITTIWGEPVTGCILPDYLYVRVTVRNRGSGEASSVNGSTHVDSLLMCVLPMAETLAASEPFNSGEVEYIWDATQFSFGEHTSGLGPRPPPATLTPGTIARRGRFSWAGHRCSRFGPTRPPRPQSQPLKGATSSVSLEASPWMMTPAGL